MKEGDDSGIRNTLVSRKSHKKTAFVLAGGGSLGSVEVGMLRALLTAGVGPDLVVGASVGAINGAFIAARPDVECVETLARIWRGVRRGDVFPFTPIGGILSLFSLKNHLLHPAPLRRLIRENLPYHDLEETAVPFHAVAIDILTGAEVVLSSGPACEAVLASAAIPGLFPPVEIGGRFLADGGVANNTPISVAAELGAERLIVLPAGFTCDLRSPPRGSLAMALQGLSLLIARQLIVDIERFQDEVELRVVPPLCPLQTTAIDFSSTAELIERAEESTRRWLEEGGLESDAIPEHFRPHFHAD